MFYVCIFFSYVIAAELYHQRQAPQSFYPHPGVIPNSMSHGNIIRSHCSTFVGGGSNSEIMALNASMLTSSNTGSTNDFVPPPHSSILRSSVDNLLSQHPMVRNSYFLYKEYRKEVKKSFEGVQITFLGTSGFSLKPKLSEAKEVL